MSLQGKRVISGTWGSIWVDSEKIQECFGLSSTIELKREEVKIAGEIFTQTKLVSCQGKGNIKMNKVSTRFVEKVFNIIETGCDGVFEIQTMLADPDSKGKETIRLKNVVFDELTLQDWEVGTPGTYELPFTFSGAEYLDKIEG